MLKFAFLPSDYHPLLLVLGEAEDLQHLAQFLARYAEGGGEVRLEAQSFATGVDTTVLIVSTGAPLGLWPAPAPSRVGDLIWRLDADFAREYAARVAALADPTLRSGSAMLEVEILGEIAIKVSRGEFVDGFLGP